MAVCDFHAHEVEKLSRKKKSCPLDSDEMVRKLECSTRFAAAIFAAKVPRNGCSITESTVKSRTSMRVSQNFVEAIADAVNARLDTMMYFPNPIESSNDLT